MAYQRNGFLEGIDAAGKLINIYHGFEDRKDQREWRQKQWDYQVGRDKVKDAQWNTTHEFNVRKQDYHEKHQDRVFGETVRHNRASEGLGWANHSLARAKYNDDLRREREQREAEEMYMTGIDGGDSGITSVDIDTVPFAIKGSFTSGLGNYAAQKFGLNIPEGASTNGVFGLLDDGKGNVVIGYLDNANGKKRVHTVGDAMPKDQAVKMLKESGATDEHVNILMGNYTERKPTEADLTAGINYEALAKLKSDRDARLSDPNMDGRTRAWWEQRYKDSISKEEANIEAQKQRNLEQFTNKQSEEDAKRDQFISEVNDSIRQERIAQEEARVATEVDRRNLARLDTLKAAYPKASKDVKEKILEEVEAINWSRGKSLTSGLTGAALVKEYKNHKKVEEAQSKGLLSGIEARSKTQYSTGVEHSDDLAKSDDINKFIKSIGDDVGKHFDTKSGKRGEASVNATKANAFVSSTYGGITNKLINSLEHKSQVTDLTLAMTRLGTKDPATAFYFLQRDGGGSSSVSETEINAAKSVFANAREYGAKHGYTDREMNTILRVVTDKMVKEGISIHKFGDVFNDVVGAKRGNNE
ncbi:TPA: hypothetical protein QB623_001301 [Pasteurella multocida]|nr:hypothetical protein [Pasteurella multocida]